MSYRMELMPRDVLFFKDARPMEASDAGCGGNWPRPDQFYNALRHAFLRQWPEMQDWEGELHTANERDRNRDKSSFRFGALKTIGLFPMKGGELYLPMPLDWEMEVIPLHQTNLPSPLTHGFCAKSQEKRRDPQWLSRTTYEAYLKGEFPKVKNEDAKLYGVDRNIGIRINAETSTTKDGAFYQAEYLRLCDGVTLVGEAECVIKPKRREGMVDVFAREDFPKDCIFGGQQGVCILSIGSGGLSLPRLSEKEISTCHLRWTLLTPALFNAGWKPGWIAEDGKVMLPRKSVERLPGERREEWKKRQNAATGFDAKLIAARIGKPVAFSGWDEQAKAPKPTVLAVSAGSSYVFRCASIDEAKALASVLNAPNRRSDLNGEKGFGIGLCSSIQVND